MAADHIHPERTDPRILLDYALLAVGLGSLLILAIEWAVPLGPAEHAWLTWIDRAVIGLFAAGLAGRLWTAGDPARRVKVRWPEFVGLLPLTEPLLTSWRFYVLVQIVVVLARVGTGLDRHLGARALSRLMERYGSMVAEEVTEPILVRGSIVAQGVLQHGRYPASVGDALEARREEIHGSVLAAAETNDHMRRLMHLPLVKRLVRGSVDATVDAAVASLTSDDMDLVVREAIDRTFEDFRTGVRESDWKTKGLSVAEVRQALRRREGAGDGEQSGRSRSGF